MIKDKTRFTANRRVFLKGAAAAGGAAAITAVSASGLVNAETEQIDKPAAADNKTSKGYHETRHIKDYYRTLRS
jgi:nitrous oxide reductase